MRVFPTNTFINTLIIILASCLPVYIDALLCYVDPTGSFSLSPSFSTVANALSSGVCNAPGTTITIVCPLSGCVHEPISIINLVEITIVSGEVDSPSTYGPLRIFDFTSTGVPHAVDIQNSGPITFSGVKKYGGLDKGIQISNSNVVVMGRPKLGGYSDVSGSNQGIYVEGNSVVNLFYVTITESKVGLEAVPDSSFTAAPIIQAAAFDVEYCQIAIQAHGIPGPKISLLSDYTDVTGITDKSQHIVHNYIMQNSEGIHSKGEAEVRVDHTIFAGNLRCPGCASGSPINPDVFRVAELSSLVLQNCLIYDNDAYPNPGKNVAWSSCTSSCVNTNGKILQHETKGSVRIVATTIIDNQNDLVFNIVPPSTPGPGGVGELILDHVVIAHNWGKVFSMSSFSGCPHIRNENLSSFLWDNRVDFDPATCAVPIDNTWNPNPLAMISAPDKTPFPDVMGPFDDLYLIQLKNPPVHLEPLPPDLYKEYEWTVDGSTVDSGEPLDVGYHNPIIPAPAPTPTPTASPTAAPTAVAFAAISAPWSATLLNVTVNFNTPEAPKSVELKYEKGAGRHVAHDLTAGDCGGNETLGPGIVTTTAEETATADPGLNLLTIRHEFDMGRLATSPLFDNATDTINFCQDLGLVYDPNGTDYLITQLLTKVSIKLNMTSGFSVEVRLDDAEVGQANETVQLRDFISAFHCEGENMVRIVDGTLRPNEVLNICIESSSEDVEIASLDDMNANNGVLSIINADQPVIAAITTLAKSALSRVVSTRLPLDRIIFANDATVEIAGSLTLQFKGSSRRLVAAAGLAGRRLQATPTDEEVAAFAVAVALEPGEEAGEPVQVAGAAATAATAAGAALGSAVAALFLAW